MWAPPRAPEREQTGNCDCDEPLKVAPHSPDAFPAPFVTRSLPQHAPLHVCVHYCSGCSELVVSGSDFISARCRGSMHDPEGMVLPGAGAKALAVGACKGHMRVRRIRTGEKVGWRGEDDS